jgi:hypothetical protein
MLDGGLPPEAREDRPGSSSLASLYFGMGHTRFESVSEARPSLSRVSIGPPMARRRWSDLAKKHTQTPPEAIVISSGNIARVKNT